MFYSHTVAEKQTGYSVTAGYLCIRPEGIFYKLIVAMEIPTNKIMAQGYILRSKYAHTCFTPTQWGSTTQKQTGSYYVVLVQVLPTS